MHKPSKIVRLMEAPCRAKIKRNGKAFVVRIVLFPFRTSGQLLLLAITTTGFMSLTSPTLASPPSFQMAQARAQTPIFAIVPLINTSPAQPATSNSLGLHLAESLATRLSQSTKLTLIEREQIEVVIKELGLAHSDLASNQAPAPQLGKLLGAQYLIVGSYHLSGQELVIQLRIVETETAKILPGAAFEFVGKQSTLASLLTQISERVSNYLQTQFVAYTPAMGAAYQQGLSALEQGQWRQAEQLFQTQIRAYPDFAQNYLGLAKVSAYQAHSNKQETDWKEALAWTEQALNRNPALMEAIILRADAQEQLKQTAASQQTLVQALARFPGQPQLVIAHLQQNQDKLKPQELKNFVLRDGGDLKDPEIQRGLGLILSQKLLLANITDISEALVLLKQAHQNQPDDNEITLSLAALYWGAEQPEEAEIYLNKLYVPAQSNSDLSKRLSNQTRMLANVYRRQNKTSQAERVLKRADELLEARRMRDPNSASLMVELAKLKTLQNLPEAAERLLLNALKTEPENPRHYLAISNLFKQAGNLAAQEQTLKAGLALFTQAQQDDLYNSMAFDLSSLYQKAQRNTEAKALLQSVRNGSDLYALGQAHLAELAEVENQWAEALAYYQLAFQTDQQLQNAPAYQNGYRRAYLHVELAKNPQQGELWNDLGQIALAERDFSRAQEYLEKALRFAKDQPVVHYNLGLLHFQKQDFDRASAAFKQALQLKPIYPKALYNLALLEYQRQQHQEALKYLKTALEQEPDYPEAQALRQKILQVF